MGSTLQIPSFWQGLFVQILETTCEQSEPVNAGKHEQVYVPPIKELAVHTPPFWHGFEMQGFRSFCQKQKLIFLFK